MTSRLHTLSKTTGVFGKVQNTPAHLIKVQTCRSDVNRFSLTKIWTGCNHTESRLKLQNVSIACWFSQYDVEGFSTLQTTEGFVSHMTMLFSLYLCTVVCTHTDLLRDLVNVLHPVRRLPVFLRMWQDLQYVTSPHLNSIRVLVSVSENRHKRTFTMAVVLRNKVILDNCCIHFDLLQLIFSCFFTTNIS